MNPSLRLYHTRLFLFTNSFQNNQVKNKCTSNSNFFNFKFINYEICQSTRTSKSSKFIYNLVNLNHKKTSFSPSTASFVRCYSSETHVDIRNNFQSVSKKQIMAAKSTNSTIPVKQNYDYFLVLDFEATCDKKADPNPQEIIEFPALKVNAKTMKIDSTFHSYVMPKFNPKLTTFCTELTGIIQSMVDNQPQFPEVLQSFHQWMESEGLLNPDTKSIFVTCGDWDLKTMLPKQCAVLDIAIKPYFRQWVNIKRSYADVTSVFPKGMMVMLDHLNLKHVGRHHSGIDDCKNIANILIALMQKGYIVKQNNRF